MNTMHTLPSPMPSTLRRAAELPGPRGMPLLGNALQIESTRFHQQLEQWCKEFGPFFKLRIGARKVVVVGDHAAVAEILRARPDGFRRTSRLEEIWTEMGLASGVFTANGDRWRHQRRLVMAGFDPTRVRAYYPSLLKVAQRLAGRWQQAAGRCAEIDLQADLKRYTVDAIAGLAFGADVNTLESDQDALQQHLDKIFPAMFKRVLAPLPTWRFMRTAADRDLERSIAEINAAVTRFIVQARARLHADPVRRAAPQNLLEAMVIAADQPDSGIDDQQVVGNVLTMLLGGEDTTANTLAWMIHLLWQHPQALQRAVDEVRRVIGDCTSPTLDQLAGLDYVEACAHETMRLKPVAPMLPLQALHDITIGDVEIPAGTIVISLMRRDSVSDLHVPHAAAFEPERWIVEGGPGPMANAAKRISMPFGAGPRICPGRYLALLEIKLAMATLLGRFDIAGVATVDGQVVQEHLSVTMGPVGLRMRLSARDPYAHRTGTKRP